MALDPMPARLALAAAARAVDDLLAQHNTAEAAWQQSLALQQATIDKLEARLEVVDPTIPDPYIVKPGDYLLKIGRTYRVQVADIMVWSGLKSDVIRPGQELRLVPPDTEPEPEPAPQPEPEPEPASRLVVGLDLGQNAWQQVPAHRAMVNNLPLRNCRVFFNPGKAPVWDDSKLKLLTPADTPWISVKTLTEASLRAFLDAMPAAYKAPGAVYNFTYQHEGEADMLASADPDAAVKSYLDTYAMIERVLADHPNGKWFQPWKILLRYTQVMDGRKGYRDSWPRFVGDQNIPVGMDCYWPPNHKTYMPAAELLGKLLEIHDKTGLRISVPEVGGVPIGGPNGRQDTDGSKRAEAIRELIAFAATTPIEVLNWWCGQGAATDYSSHHLEAFPSNVAAWAAGMAAHQPA